MSATAFDTNALQSDPDFCRASLRDADLLRALFEGSGLTAQMSENLTGEMK
jgi:hypothetical protein